MLAVAQFLRFIVFIGFSLFLANKKSYLLCPCAVYSIHLFMCAFYCCRGSCIAVDILASPSLPASSNSRPPSLFVPLLQHSVNKKGKRNKEIYEEKKCRTHAGNFPNGNKTHYTYTRAVKINRHIFELSAGCAHTHHSESVEVYCLTHEHRARRSSCIYTHFLFQAVFHLSQLLSFGVICLPF